MKKAIALVGLLVTLPLSAVVAPKIVAGDYLFVYAKVVNCGLEPQAIDYAQVDEDGYATFFGDISLTAKDRAVYKIRNELVGVMEKRTGHRPLTLELIHIPGSDKEAVAKQLVFFSLEAMQRCAPIILPPGELDPNWEQNFERLVRSGRIESGVRGYSG